MKPNIVLITVDQMRGDCLGVKNHPFVETPNLDMMAHYGVFFTNTYSAVPSCIAARAALLTGLSQKTHGRVGYEDGVAWKYDITLPGELAKAGYHTQGIGKMHFHPARILNGFHNVILHDGYLGFGRNRNNSAFKWLNQYDDYLHWLKQQRSEIVDVLDIDGLRANSWVSRSWPIEEYLHPTNWVVTESIDFLRRRDPEKPFFLHMSFVRPHPPLDPPEYFFDMYINENIPDPPVGDWADREDNEREGLNIDCFKGNVNKRALKRARAAYYALITHIDHQIGRFIQFLKEYDIQDNTIVLFTSDHGDMLGDHNLFRKGFPYQGSISVPFIVYDPGNLLKKENNMVIENPVELRDIMPTILDIAGVDIPGSVEGRSVIPLIKQAITNKDGVEWREYIHGEHSLGKDSSHYITNGKEKYIWFSQTGKEQFFDLEKDAYEMVNLAKDSEYRERVEYWRNILVKELTGREEGYSDGFRLIAGKKPLNCLHFPFHGLGG